MFIDSNAARSGATLVVVAALILFGIARTAGAADHSFKPHPTRVSADVAEDHTRFVFDENGPLLEGGFPDYGNAFVTRGYLYPHGYLQPGDSGVNDDGSPAYPQDVIGEWTCRGVFVGQGFATLSGPIVETTQLYSFYRDPGYDPAKLAAARTIATEGFELADLGVGVKRAVTGGTGKYRGARGQMVQELIGLSEQMAVQLRVRFKLQ